MPTRAANRNAAGVSAASAKRHISPARLGAAALLVAAVLIYIHNTQVQEVIPEIDEELDPVGASTDSGTHAERLNTCLRDSGGQRTKVFLFIGIISARNNYKRRGAVRDAWTDGSQVEGVSMTRFFVPSKGDTHKWTAKEMAAHSDFVYLDLEATYQTIGAQTFAVFEHVVAEYDYSFVLKTDDDSFVNVPALVTDLRGKCTTPGCHNERLYMGFQVEDIVVTYLLPDHPHNSAEFFAHTGLKHYPKYMVGGGYVISDDVARLVVLSNQLVGLKLYTVEDATFGYWLQPWNIRHVNHTRFRTIADFCCFDMPNATQPAVSLDLYPYVERNLCGQKPWLILHKVGEAKQMRYLGDRVRNCSSDPARLEGAARLAVL